MAGEEFPIVVAIKPDVTAGEQAVDKSLAQLETHAKTTGDAIGKALGGGFTEAATKAKAGDAAIRAFAASTEAASKAANDERRALEAASKAANDERRALSSLAQAFGALEAATLPAVRAEREYAAAAKLAADAVKAGVATEQQAAAVLTEKAKALEQVTVAQEDAAAGMDAYDASIGKVTEGVTDAGFSLKDFGRTVGDIMQPIGAVNNLLQLGATALNLYNKALKAAAAGVAEFIATGDPQGTLGKELVASREARVTDAIGYVPSALFAQIYGNGSAAELEKAIADYKATHRQGMDVVRQADAEYKAYLAGKPSEIKYRQEQEWVEKLAAKGRAEQARKEEAAALAAHRDPKAEAAALVAAQAEIELISSWAEQAADYAAAAYAASKAVNDERRALAQAFGALEAATLPAVRAEREYAAAAKLAADAVKAGVATEQQALAVLAEKARALQQVTVAQEDAAAGKILDLADGLDKTNAKAATAKDEISMFDEAVAKAAAGSVADLVDVMAQMTAEWDFSADALKAWGETALRVISEVILKLAALALVQQIFGQFGGKNANGFGSLLFQALGGSRPSTSARTAPAGDPFGGAGGGNTSNVSFREPVPSGGNTPGGSTGGQAVQLKVVVVSNERDAAREFIEGPEGERVVLAHTAKHRGKLGALR